MRIYTGFLFASLCVLGIYGADIASTTASHSTASAEQTTKSPEVPTSLPTKAVTTEETTTEHTTTVTVETTVPPITTTTVETTVAPSPSTTVAPTPLPNPDKGTWDVTQHNTTCIRAEMAVQIKITELNITTKHNLSPNATYDESECNFNGNGTEQSLVLVDGDFKLTFIFAKDSTQTYIQNISVSWTSADERTKSGKFFTMMNDWSYLCNAHQSIELKNVTLDMSLVHLQAFGKTDNKDFYKAQECSKDGDKMNDIVPIAVGLVLVVMVVIILIGYLIGRRRQAHQRGYQSM